ncbi:MAG: 1-deoxy-D-xylulose-5-phosphate synthase [Pseudomonadota bacterium]
MSDIPGYALLGDVNTPQDLRSLPPEQLPALAVELRRYLIETLGRIGGHFAASLGTIELALALHRVFDTPNDRLIWDVGHQALPHKLLTGRRTRLETLNRKGGLAPFLMRAESQYDAFGAGHSSTSISAALGMAVAAKLAGENRRAIAVIGDGGLTAGMAYEALNHAGQLGLDLTVVLNDNGMSISPNVGALNERPSLAPFFETLGFAYQGPIDGHSLSALIPALEKLKDARGPQLLHVKTVKGKGFAAAERDSIKYHRVTGFDPVTGALPAGKSAAPSYTQIFSDWLCDAAEKNPKLVAVTPAMREGSGLGEFARRFPDRYLDAGIAEQHAVTLAAGLACEGFHPVVATYSTFFQRAYDQIIHDVAVQNLPVLFALDRGGLVGPDGATHHGAFDFSFLRCIPNLVVMAPSDEADCRRMLATGLAHSGPSAVRYPRGSGPGAQVSRDLETLPIGKARVVREARGHRKPRVAILAFGALVQTALEAAELLDATVVDMRFVKPLDVALILDLARENDLLVTLEDNVIAGGAGSGVNEVLASHQQHVAVMNLGLPDQFIEHGTREELLVQCSLDCAGIQRAIQKRLRAKDLSEKERFPVAS